MSENMHGTHDNLSRGHLSENKLIKQANLRQLEACREVMLTGSFTNAARRLGISQPAVSKLISDLEDYFGVKLFERFNTQIAPTEIACKIMEDFESVHANLERFIDAANITAKQRKETVKFGVLPVYADTLAPIMLSRFHKAYPNTFYVLEVLAHDALVKAVLTNEVDFALTTIPTKINSLVEHFVFTESITAVLPANHRLSRREEISLRELENEPMITLPSSSPFQQMIDEYFRINNFNPSRVMQARNQASIKSLVRLGVGISILVNAMPHFDSDQLQFANLNNSMKIKCGIIFDVNSKAQKIMGEFLAITESIIRTNLITKSST